MPSVTWMAKVTHARKVSESLLGLRNSVSIAIVLKLGCSNPFSEDCVLSESRDYAYILIICCWISEFSLISISRYATILADEVGKEGALICKWHVHTEGKPRGGRMVFCSSQGLWQLMTFFTSQAMISLQQDTMINCIILFWFLNCIRAISKSTWYWIVLVLYIFKQHCDKSNLKWCWRSRRCYLSFKRCLCIIQRCCTLTSFHICI